MHARLNRLTLLALAGIAALCTASGAHATTWFVSTCGNDAWAGLNVNCIAPLGPKRTIQAAINAAANGDTVLIMPGTYFQTIDFDGKEISVSGAAGPATTIIDGGGNGPVVLCNSLEGAGTTLTGLTIRNGYNDAANGAGMIVALASPTVTNCIFRNNVADTSVAGGGIAATTSSLTVNNCQFIDNTGWSAGGILVFNGSATVSGCTFDGNNGMNRGGGMYIHNADVEITDSSFINGFVGAWDAAGAGLYIDENSDVTMDGCTISDNVPFRGVAGIWISNDSTLSLFDCDFANNHATSPQADGNAISARNSAVSMTACNFTGNYGGDSGGAINAIESSITATFCGFLNNSTDGGGGAISLNDSSLVANLSTFGGNTAVVGGAISGHNQSSAILNGCALSNNTAVELGWGGAVRFSGGMFEAEGCTFAGNSAVIGGGAWFDGLASVSFEDCAFEDNDATSGHGGAIRAVNTPVSIVGGEIVGNHSGSSGGGVYFEGPNALLSLSEVQLGANVAAVVGGAVSTASSTTIEGCGFLGNSAHDAGALAIGGAFGDVRAVSCRFDSNHADQVGGAIMVGAFSAGSELLLVNSIISNSTAAFGGGAIHESALGGHTRLVNCAVVDNSGGGLIIANGATQSVLSNTVLWGNHGGATIGGNQPLVRFSNVQGGFAGVGNMNANPMFVNAVVGNYALAAGSPCIDAGATWALPGDQLDMDDDNNTVELVPHDYNGNARITDNPAAADGTCGGLARVDIGPIETAGNAVSNLKPGDANGDGVVDVDDLLAVITTWGPCPGSCCPADFDLSGQIDVNDLLTVITKWG